MAESTRTTHGAWYDVSYRVSAAKAVASTIPEILDCCSDIPPRLIQPFSDAGYIAGAVRDLLELVERDMALLEQQIRGGSQ